MNVIDEQVINRRKKLEDDRMPADASRKWGLALSGGGIRSATFCFGLVRALACNNVLLRFDLMSTVSGGGYIGSMLGNLFQRASSGNDARNINKAVGGCDSAWFIWWLRANGRYLIPRGARDQAFAFATYLRNLTAVHFELGMAAVLLGIALGLVDLGVWWSLERLGYASDTVFTYLRWWSKWIPAIWVLLPFFALAGAIYAGAYWALAWASRTRRFALGWLLTALAGVALVAMFQNFDSQSTDNDGATFRYAVWYVCYGLIGIWLVAAIVARATLPPRHDESPNDYSLRATRARHRLTRKLTGCLIVFAAVGIAGVVDRLAWYFAFELGSIVKPAAFLAIAAALLRVLMPLAAALAPRISSPLPIAIARLLGYVLALLLCAWWVALVYKLAMGELFTKIWPQYDQARTDLLLLLVPVAGYMLVTGANFTFLNLSSLHAFYKSRLTRSYLGAANHRRFGERAALGALESVPSTWPAGKSTISVREICFGDDSPLTRYQPQREGGPVHLLTVCVNQTVDPRGRLFNQDRCGLPLTVASGGHMRVSLGEWTALAEPGSLSIGAWTAISGAALSPGMGSVTRGGMAALATFAGVRLGYWWTRKERENLPHGAPMRRASRLLAKTRGLLNETFGSFAGTEGDNWFLTDGGHFENTGAYALLAERAQVIVLADCGADPKFRFGDLENLVRKARIDLGIRINFQRLRSDMPVSGTSHSCLQKLISFGSLNEISSPNSSACLALAKIRYDEDSEPGILIVVKPNLCAGLPVDLVNFKAQNVDFPQQTTADQFFSEAQFESYFMLGQFLGSDLDYGFIDYLLEHADEHFENDDCSPFDASSQTNGGAANGKLSGRLPSRIAATAVGTTLGIGAVTTTGVAAWQAIESARTAAARQESDEHNALKDLADLWAGLPSVNPGTPIPDSEAQAFGKVAAALVRTADTLCPSGEAEWFKASPLAARITRDTLQGCTNLAAAKRTAACRLLVEAATPALGTTLPQCIMKPADTLTLATLPVRYGPYDYGANAQYPSRHPCDPARYATLAAEADFEFLNGPLAEKPSALGRAGEEIESLAQGCHGLNHDKRLQASKPSTTVAQQPEVEPAPPPLAGFVPPASAPASASALHPPPPPASATAATTPASQAAAIAADICRNVTVYIQIYGSSQRGTANGYRDKWRAIGASVPAIEDVLDTARRNGRAGPMPVTHTTVRFHDRASKACAKALGPEVGTSEWTVEPLSANLQAIPHTIEVWIAPSPTP
ncbi:hypothetical protein LMG28688_05614 [Paraburkholderia caffeinitolerans]|uniref:PNPLA domain-containing protein n=1 Tax=Paraburkholderia caffeinitolerans TaxID=1723730 RepID=A0A6J5GKW3_9BURK|nr:patatin-like phospholipase family protein [Paraburkholderia caffeinitolerans]CAB3802682.1 hypothetical protein LMG28688_05614 [Paraburkholderia caffeinitolerans]